MTAIVTPFWASIGRRVFHKSHNILFANEVFFATNPSKPLKPADCGLYVGTNKNLDTGMFFSGFIDDILIYDVALTAEEIADLPQ